MSDSEFINPGGINGLGEGQIDTNSNEFKALQAAIKAMAVGKTAEQNLEDTSE